MKLKIELSKKKIVNALGKGYREIELSKGNGGCTPTGDGENRS